MPRVPVPDDYERDSILVAGTGDYHYPEADVQVQADSARSLQVREDDEGRYCGPPAQFVDAVREFLGVTESSNTESEDDADDDSVEICGAEKSDGETCERPADECPYHGDSE